MNKFDEFIESADKDLEMDTSTRVRTGTTTSPSLISPTRTISGGSRNQKKDANEGNKVHSHLRQFTPKKLTYQDHPLKEVTGQNIGNSSTSRQNTSLNKRRSLIQPIVAPKTPENPSKQGNKINHNNSAPAKLVVERGLHAERKRSKSNVSLASPSGGIQSEKEELALGSSIDVSALLQNLANKELELLEGKHRIEELKKQVTFEQQSYQGRVVELRELQEQVSNYFNQKKTAPITELTKEVKSPSQATINLTKTTNEHHEAAVKKAAQYYASRTSPKETDTEPRPSVWSKPLAIFNQFDQIIQHELERSLNWDDSSSTTPKNMGRRIEQQKASDADTRSSQIRQPMQEEPSSVSKSIWNFVNDVKTGLLGIEEDEDKELANERTFQEGSPVASNNDTEATGLGIKQFITTNKNRDESPGTTGDNKLKFIDDKACDESIEEALPANRDVEMTELRK